MGTDYDELFYIFLEYFYKNGYDIEEIVFKYPLFIKYIPDTIFSKIAEKYINTFYLCGNLKNAVNKKCEVCKLPCVDEYNRFQVMDYVYDNSLIDGLNDIKLNSLKTEYGYAI